MRNQNGAGWVECEGAADTCHTIIWPTELKVGHHGTHSGAAHTAVSSLVVPTAAGRGRQTGGWAKIEVIVVTIVHLYRAATTKETIRPARGIEA